MTQDQQQHLKRVAATRRVADDAKQASAGAYAEWFDAVWAAHKAGLSYRKIAEAAGVSHPRIQQIVREYADQQEAVK